ncbi:MAG: dual specificity protein phosphatase family protein, partial [Bacteriovorax sp.]
HAWFILIYISTLTVYQHHFVDLLGGQLVGLASFVLFPYKEKAEFRNNRFAFIYYFVSFALFSASFFTPLFFTAISLYLSLSYFLVGFLYQFPEKNLIVKTNGRHSLMVKFLFGHFMLSCWLIWFYASLKSKIKYAEVLPNIYFGERPNNIEDTPIKLNENWAVIDLAPEISAHPDLVKLDYHYFPFNDLSYPKKEWLHSITDVIDDLLRKGKKVYVHCRLGQTRSALVICAYLIFKQNHSPKEALELVSSLKKINLAYDLRKIFTDSDPY